MLNTIIRTIEKHKMIVKGDCIVVGVSGGPDSVALLHGLWTLREALDIRLVAVHLDHGYRGEASAADAAYVKGLCQRLDIPFHGFYEDIEAMAKENGLSFEDMGRTRRYDLFFQVMKQVKATKVAVAHNRNDQVETVLMRIMRGTGMDGMQGIPYTRDDGIIRPLLDVDREAIEAYCTCHQLEPRTDATNLENVYTRNRIRLDVIPYIETHFNPAFKETLLRNVEVLTEDVQYLNLVATGAFETIVIRSRADCWSMSVEAFKVLHPAIQKRLIRKIIHDFSGSLTNVTGMQVQALVDMIHKNQTGKRRVLPNGMTFIMDYNQVMVQAHHTVEEGPWEYGIDLNEGVEVKEANIRMKAMRCPVNEHCTASPDETTICIDADCISGALRVRNRLPGDRFSPLGLTGTKKLKDYFIDLKIHRDKRWRVPLLCDDVGILWVLGYQMDNRCRVTPQTKACIKIEFENLQEL